MRELVPADSIIAQKLKNCNHYQKKALDKPEVIVYNSIQSRFYGKKHKNVKAEK